MDRGTIPGHNVCGGRARKKVVVIGGGADQALEALPPQPVDTGLADRKNEMEAQRPDKEKRQPKASAHVCPQYGFAIDLKNLGLREGATGLVTCPKCDWSGPVTIGIVPKDSTN